MSRSGADAHTQSARRPSGRTTAAWASLPTRTRPNRTSSAARRSLPPGSTSPSLHILLLTSTTHTHRRLTIRQHHLRLCPPTATSRAAPISASLSDASLSRVISGPIYLVRRTQYRAERARSLMRRQAPQPARPRRRRSPRDLITRMARQKAPKTRMRSILRGLCSASRRGRIPRRRGRGARRAQREPEQSRAAARRTRPPPAISGAGSQTHSSRKAAARAARAWSAARPRAPGSTVAEPARQLRILQVAVTPLRLGAQSRTASKHHSRCRVPPHDASYVAIRRRAPPHTHGRRAGAPVLARAEQRLREEDSHRRTCAPLRPRPARPYARRGLAGEERVRFRARRRRHTRACADGQRVLDACEWASHVAREPHDGRAEPRELASGRGWRRADGSWRACAWAVRTQLARTQRGGRPAHNRTDATCAWAQRRGLAGRQRDVRECVLRHADARTGPARDDARCTWRERVRRGAARSTPKHASQRAYCRRIARRYPPRVGGRARALE
jgi:hypothetical protein